MTHPSAFSRPHRTGRFLIVVTAMLIAAVTSSSCGGGDDNADDAGTENTAVWCDHLDQLIKEAWEYDGGANFGGTPDDMNRIVRDDFRENSDYSDEAMASLNDALEEAWSAGNRYDGKEAARAWEDSLRDAC